MRTFKNVIFCHRHHRFAICFLILVISTSSHLSFYINAEGRRLTQIADNSKTVNEEKPSLRAQIGSRPPRCDRRCISCGPCKAIQVPTNPQIRRENRSSTALISVIAYARGDDSSNYKPMSWKCKCGNLIFSP